MSLFRFARPEARGLPDMRELFLRVFTQAPRSGADPVKRSVAFYKRL